MLASLATTQVVIDAGWLVLIAAAIPIAVYMVRRRDAQSSTVTKSEILTEKSVRNIEELWEKRDDLRDRIESLRVEVAEIRGERKAERRLQPRPPADNN